LAWRAAPAAERITTATPIWTDVFLHKANASDNRYVRVAAHAQERTICVLGARRLGLEAEMVCDRTS
jgi:hypothetical protein